MRSLAEIAVTLPGLHLPPLDVIRSATPGELAAWHRRDRAERGVVLEGRTCRTCGGDGAIDGGRTWCPDCDGNCVEKASKCRSCDGHGVVRNPESPVANVAAMPCPTCHGGLSRIGTVLDSAGVPTFYQSYSWDGYIALPDPDDSQSAAFALAGALASDPRRYHDEHGKHGLCLVGPPGTRKTGICIPAFRDLAESRYMRARFISWRAWLDEMAATWRGESPVTAAQMIRDASTAELLMIDDFGGALGADRREWVADTAWKLLEARQSVPTPLLVTTNRTIAEVERQYGEATISRLHALCVVTHVRGRDERTRDQ